MLGSPPTAGRSAATTDAAAAEEDADAEEDGRHDQPVGQRGWLAARDCNTIQNYVSDKKQSRLHELLPTY